MSKIALINPDYYGQIFNDSKVRSAVLPGLTPLHLACIAAPLLAAGHKVKILDLNIVKDPQIYLRKEIREFKPEFAGITSTTPLISKAGRAAKAIKEISKTTFVVAGGPHPSALPEEVLRMSEIDCVVRGEGDFIFKSIVEKGPSRDINNIFFKKDGQIISSDVQNDFIEDLDSLPYPAYELLDIQKYRQPRIVNRRSPLAYLETSRGCWGRCIFCNKNIHGFKVRMKSYLRVVDEMERALGLGFKEIQVIDDIFTADMNRTYAICEEILKRKLKFSWYPRGGIRVDRVDSRLLKIMKKAGCYRVPFGIESGSQRVIDSIGKNITLKQAKEAVAMAKEAGLETECYFMLGLPTEKEEDIRETIDFSIELDPDYAKFAIAIPLPGTAMFKEMDAAGRIKTKDWDKYNFSISPKELYEHDLLSWEVIDNYYSLSHRKFYFRIGYIFSMLYKTLTRGTFFAHIKAFLNTRW